MSHSAYLVAAALRRIAAALERMSDEELSKLGDTGAEIEIKVVRRRSKEETSLDERLNLADIVSKLTAFPSRGDASNFLENTFQTKKNLEQIARHLDVSVLKQDKVDTLRDKIIEATVGARLRSEAIKGSD